MTFHCFGFASLGLDAYIAPVPELFSRPIDAATHYCAVYGHPIKHSASPAMQNAGLAALGLNWRYLAFEVRPENLAAALSGAKAMGFIGVNLTVPHKLLALDLVDYVDPVARVWGAVNTIRFEGREREGAGWKPFGEITTAPTEARACGFNTDADAITRAIREDLGLTVPDSKVLLLGAGGAGRTAALKLASEGVDELWLVNRTQSKAEAVLQEIGARWPRVKARIGYPQGKVDLLLNATSLGLRREDPLPWNEADFPLKKAGYAYDMIYRPAETPFLKSAKAAGCRTANGIGMLLYQGAAALEIWTGQAAPVEIMRRELEKNVYG